MFRCTSLPLNLMIFRSICFLKPKFDTMSIHLHEVQGEWSMQSHLGHQSYRLLSNVLHNDFQTYQSHLLLMASLYPLYAPDLIFSLTDASIYFMLSAVAFMRSIGCIAPDMKIAILWQRQTAPEHASTRQQDLPQARIRPSERLFCAYTPGRRFPPARITAERIASSPSLCSPPPAPLREPLWDQRS